MSRWHFQLRFRLLLVGGMLFALIVGNRLGADQAVPRHPIKNLPEIDGKESDRVAEEILQIRQAIGSAWRGEDFESPSDAESIPHDQEIIRTALIAQVQAESQESSSEPVSIPPAPNQQVALREAAHQLDLTAHELECQKLYEQADELRATAQRFRNQARSEPIPPLNPVRKGGKLVPAKTAD